MSGKILITGASGGIGSAICEKFVDKKFTLILTSSSESKILKLKEKYGDKHYYYNIDLSNPENVQNSLDEISKIHKDISIIVNNEGKTHDNIIFRMKIPKLWSS